MQLLTIKIFCLSGSHNKFHVILIGKTFLGHTVHFALQVMNDVCDLGWCFSAVMLFLSPRVSTANFEWWLVLVCCNLQSLSLEFSVASVSLIHCNLVSLTSEGSFHFFAYFSAVKWPSSLSSAFGTVLHPQFSQPFAPLVRCLFSTSGFVSFCAIAGVLASALIWELF